MEEGVPSRGMCLGYAAASVPGALEEWPGRAARETRQGWASTGKGAVHGECPTTKLGVLLLMEINCHDRKNM